MPDDMTAEIPYFDNSHFFTNGDTVYIQRSADFPAFVGVKHRHQFVEIVYILSGKAEHRVGQRSYCVKPGDVVMINAGVPHQFIADPTAGEAFVSYDLMFAPEFFDAVTLETGAFESLKNSFLFFTIFPDESPAQPDMYIPRGRNGNYGELFTQLYREFRRKEKGYLSLMRAYIIELIIKLFRDVEQPQHGLLSPENLQRIYDAVDLIEAHYTERLAINELAAQVYMSPEYFRKLFKKVTGNTVTAYQQKYRVDKACQLLATTNIPIRQICEAVGYGDLKSFYSLFKRIAGKTPQEYRNNPTKL